MISGKYTWELDYNYNKTLYPIINIDKGCLLRTFTKFSLASLFRAPPNTVQG